MQVLVLHDGELEDVCGILGALGQPYTERRGGVALPDAARCFDLVVATPGRLLRADALLRPETRSIVVAVQLSHTLSRKLARLGVDLLVRRPVHPETLRLLLVHSLYRGPERRRAARVAVGTAVVVRTRWRPHRALLLDLSVRGARLRAGAGLRPGTPVRLRVPGDGGPLWLVGEVTRARALRAGGHEVGVVFRHPEREKLPRLRELVDAHARGPAPWRDPLPGPSAEGERRGGARRAYERRVIALSPSGPRVLLGRDLSAGGMRVDGHAGLLAGESLQVALHVRPGDVPLVLTAEVVRDDGRGVALRFPSLGRAERERLEKMLDDLPTLAAPTTAGDEGRVLAEVVGAR